MINYRGSVYRDPALKLFLSKKKESAMLGNIFLVSIAITIFGSVWAGICAEKWNPYFYSLPFRKKFFRFYLPVGIASIGFISMIGSVKYPFL